MTDVGKAEYVKICIRYRIISLLFSTVVFLIWLPKKGHMGYGGLVVAAGMIAACAIGTYLYTKTIMEEENKVWLVLTMVLEMGAYGIFICLSGGLRSPYLWYFAGCLYLMAAVKWSRPVRISGVAWCLFCILIGAGVFYRDQSFSESDMNNLLGILIVTGGFYTIQSYVGRLEEEKRETVLLNGELAEEKEATEQALCQITVLYDTVKLFSITNQKRSMDETTSLLMRSVAPDGCLLIKFKMDGEGETDMMSSCGLDSDTVSQILEQIKKMPYEMEEEEPAEFRVQERSFFIRKIGKGIFLQGVFITGEKEQEKKLPFYLHLIETIFKDMDMQRSLEEGMIKEEQRRIASEIHDTVIQKLFGIACSLRALQCAANGMTGEDMTGRLSGIETSVRLAMQELRETIYGVKFENCDRETFKERLELYLKEAERLFDVTITLEMTGNFFRLSAGQKTVTYRIICEAVNNAIRHGKAGKIEVEAAAGEKEVDFFIKDDGFGFSTQNKNTGNGLKNMYQMATILKGTLSVQSEPGKGTRVSVSLPL